MIIKNNNDFQPAHLDVRDLQQALQQAAADPSKQVYVTSVGFEALSKQLPGALSLREFFEEAANGRYRHMTARLEKAGTDLRTAKLVTYAFWKALGKPSGTPLEHSLFLVLKKDKTLLQPLTGKGKKQYVKLSRRTHPELLNSLFITRDGRVFEQVHGRLPEDKRLLSDNSAVKSVYDIRYIGTIDLSDHSPDAALRLVRDRKGDDFLRLVAKPGQERAVDLDLHRRLSDAFGDDERFGLGRLDRHQSAKTNKEKLTWIAQNLGADADKFLRNEWPKLSERQQNSIMLQMAQILEKMHRKGWAHLDVKLQNMLIRKSGDGEYKVAYIDFDGSTQMRAGDLASPGTPEYMGPDRCDIDDLAAAQKADVFALGIALYKLRYGADASFLPTNVTGPQRQFAFMFLNYDQIAERAQPGFMNQQTNLDRLIYRMINPTDAQSRPSMQEVLSDLRTELLVTESLRQSLRVSAESEGTN